MTKEHKRYLVLRIYIEISTDQLIDYVHTSRYFITVIPTVLDYLVDLISSSGLLTAPCATTSHVSIKSNGCLPEMIGFSNLWRKIAVLTFWHKHFVFMK